MGLLQDMTTHHDQAVQMDALRRAEGRQVDALFLALMSEHARGGADMADQAAGAVDDPDVKALADAVARNQRIEINEYDAAVIGPGGRSRGTYWDAPSMGSVYP